jgi:hypothetical protein
VCWRCCQSCLEAGQSQVGYEPELLLISNAAVSTACRATVVPLLADTLSVSVDRLGTTPGQVQSSLYCAASPRRATDRRTDYSVNRADQSQQPTSVRTVMDADGRRVTEKPDVLPPLSAVGQPIAVPVNVDRQIRAHSNCVHIRAA